jgi:hypothetical protein
MFGRDGAEIVARQALDMGIETKAGLAAHMHTCENNQRRIEGEFISVKQVLGAQDERFRNFELQSAKRANKMLAGIVTAAAAGLIQVILHFLPTSLHL